MTRSELNVTVKDDHMIPLSPDLDLLFSLSKRKKKNKNEETFLRNQPLEEYINIKKQDPNGA